jgi:hypothetical protein
MIVETRRFQAQGKTAFPNLYEPHLGALVRIRRRRRRRHAGLHVVDGSTRGGELRGEERRLGRRRVGLHSFPGWCQIGYMDHRTGCHQLNAL